MSYNESLSYTNTQSPSGFEDIPNKANIDEREKLRKDERLQMAESALRSYERSSPGNEPSPGKLDYFTTDSHVPFEYSNQSDKKNQIDDNGVYQQQRPIESNGVAPFDRNASHDEQDSSSYDYISMKNAILNDLISSKNLKKSPGKKTPRETQSPDNFYPRYISKKDRIVLTMKGPNTFNKSPGEVSSPISERKIPPQKSLTKKNTPAIYEPKSPIPEERGFNMEDVQEQRFVEEAEAPKKLNVRMEENFHDDSRDYPAAYNTHQSSAKKEPKSNRKAEIKRNMGNYEPFKPEHPHVFSNNVFEDLDVGNEKESTELLSRLKDRYEKIYRDNFLLDRVEHKKYHPTENKRLKSPQQEANLPFVSKEDVRESQLIASLISPAKAEVQAIDDIDNPELREFQEQHYRSPPRYVEKKNRSPKKQILHPIFQNFEKEAYINNLNSENNEEQQPENNKTNQTMRSAQKNQKKPKQPKVQDLNKVEDLLLELQRTVTSNGGNLTNPLSSKIVQMMNAQPVVNNYQRKKQDDNLKIDDSRDTTTKSESQILKDQIDKLAQEFNPKVINYHLKPFKDDKIRLLAWSAYISLAGAYDKDHIKITFQHFTGTFDDCINFINQPGIVNVSIKSITNNIEKKGLLKTLYNDFINFYYDLQEELDRDRVERKEEILLFKLLFLLDSFIKALERENKLKVENNNEQKINLNYKKNSEYLENRKRREENGEFREEKDEENTDKAYGIDFQKWEDNLKALEEENKLLVKFENEKQWKEEKKAKREIVKAQKEEQEKDIIEYMEESKKQKEQEILKKKKAQEEKKEAIAEKVELYKHTKQLTKAQQKEQEEEERKKMIDQKKFQDQVKKKEQARLKQKFNENIERINEEKSIKTHQQVVSKQIEKEERVWKKAQELLEKQKRLLQERDKLTNDLKLLKN